MSNEIVTLSIIILRRKMKIVGRAQISSIRKKKKKEQKWSDGAATTEKSIWNCVHSMTV